MTSSAPRFVASDELINTIQRQYGLPPVTGQRDLGGSYNLNLLIEGAGFPLVVRIYHDEMTAGRVESLQKIRRYLTSNGIPTAPLLRTVDGIGWTTFGGRIIEVERFAPSDAKMDSWERLLAGMPLFARLHDLLRAAPIDQSAAITPVANHVPAKDARAYVEFGVAAIRKWGPIPTEAYYADIARRLANRLWTVEWKFGNVPRQLVHGDFLGQQHLFSRGHNHRGRRFRFRRRTTPGRRPGPHPLLCERAVRPARDTGATARTRRPIFGGRRGAAGKIEWAALPYAIARSPLCFIGQLPYNAVAHARAELVSDRGPQCEWALRAINSPRWLNAFRPDTVDGENAH